ncbi:MAG: PKD domain-containing protein, partial [bacterium]|nr:PKD domain-containing protein [bacterium]
MWNRYRDQGGIHQSRGCIPPQADFTASTTTPCSGTAVTFTDTSTGSITSWSWNFGDGGTSTARNPVHTYTDSGTYTVSLTVSDTCGSDSKTRTAYITVAPCLLDIRINEVAFNETNDWIELKVMGTGVYDGYRIYEGAKLIATIPAWRSLTAGDFIVVHEESGTNDTNKTNNNYGYWDIYGAGDLTKTDNIIQIKMPTGDNRRVDVVIYSDNSSKFTSNQTEANGAVADGHWDTGSVFSNSRDSDAWTDSDKVSTGKSIGRDTSSTDTNSRIDWTIKTLLTPGAANFIPPTADAGGPYSGNETDTITLNAGASTDSDGKITLYEWDINNNGTYEISTSDSSYAYSWMDDYSDSVILRVTDNDSQTNTASVSVRISNRAPIASADGPYSGGIGDTITLAGTAVDSSPHDTFTYNWDLNNDGTYETLSTQNPSTSWNVAGTYSVTLKVTDDDGGIDTDTTKVVISDRIPPVVTITAPNNGNNTTTTQPQIIISGWASDTGTGVVTVSLNTGDSNTGNTVNFSFLVTLNPDTNTFVITARDGAGNTGTDTIIIYYSSPCPVLAADFTAGDTSGCVPLVVNFSDSSTGDVLSWLWDFGDGTTSSDSNPSHTYTDSGTYTVSLTVSDTCGSDTRTQTACITVNCCSTVAADFSGSPATTGCAPLTVNFSDSSTGDVLSWWWDFGDGDTSAIKNPSHTYTDSGNYTVSLTVSDTCDSDSETKTGYITVDCCSTIAADFSGTPTTGCVPLTVDFSDSSTGPALSWWWNFGDGNTSSDSNPSHTYNNPGTYTVTLTASDACGSDSNQVVVRADKSLIETEIVALSLTGYAPLTVNFSDSTSGDVTSFLWDFGDGDTSTVQSPDHTYNNPGPYTVTLTASDACGSDTDQVVVRVNPCLTDVRINEVAFKEANDWIEFYIGGTYLGGLRVYKGTTLVKELPDINVSAGDYAILHFGGNPANDENDTTGQGANGYWDIYTSNPGLTGTDDIVRVQMPGTSSVSPTNTLDAVLWSNNDGSFTGNKSVANDLVAAGLWDAGFDFNAGDSGAWIDSDDISPGESIGRDCCSTDNNSRNDWSKFTSQTMGAVNSVTVVVAEFSGTPTSGCAPLSVCFADSSTGNITGWSWDLDGDGLADTTVRNPCRAYDTPGSYSVTLKVSGACESDS